MNSNSIEEQQDANWCRSYWNLLIILIICAYNVEKKIVKKKHKYKDTFPFYLKYPNRNLFWHDET